MKLKLWLEFDCLVAPFLWNRQQLVSQPETFGSDLHRLDRNPSSGRRANGCQSFCSLADGWHLLLLLHRSCSQGSNRGAFCRASGGRDAINDCKLQEIDKANTRVWSPNWWCVVCPPLPTYSHYATHSPLKRFNFRLYFGRLYSLLLLICVLFGRNIAVSRYKTAHVILFSLAATYYAASQK